MKVEMRDIVPEIAVNVGMSEKNVKDVLEGLAWVVKDHLSDGDEVAVKNLGVFGSKMTAERDVVLPKSGKCIRTTPRRIPSFKASNCIKMALRETGK